VADVKFVSDLLLRLLAIDGPSGDEGAMADWLDAYCAERHPQARRERLGDSVIVAKGEKPAVALFAHIDTTGYTRGYRRQMIPLGGPAPEPGERVRPAARPDAGNRLERRKSGGWKLTGKAGAPPGSRWVYSAEPVIRGSRITAPYLDNRAGVWAALQVLERCPSVAVAFTVGEEHSGQGAFLCARRLYEHYAVTQALVSDITWHARHIRCGRGPAISLRDRMAPRQRILDKVLALAEESGLAYQREIETAGGSDGSYIERSGVPIGWVFVGAPEKKPHTSRERLDLGDLSGMADLLVFLVNSLTP
jgi:putative aminopeptidase FrvX